MMNLIRGILVNLRLLHTSRFNYLNQWPCTDQTISLSDWDEYVARLRIIPEKEEEEKKQKC